MKTRNWNIRYGTSLWVEEFWIQFWEGCRKDPKATMELLLSKMNERFNLTEDEE